MSKREALLFLAERCEKYEGSDALDKAIAHECQIEWSSDEDGNFVGYGILPRRCRFSRSLDAAMTLVPPAYTIEIVQSAVDREWRAYGFRNGADRAFGWANAPALAICAMALKARATDSATPEFTGVSG